MSIVVNFASVGLMTLLNTIFAVSSPTFLVLVPPLNSNQSPPVVILVRFTSSFSGLLSTTTLAYIAFLFFGTCSFLIQNSVSVPLIR